MNIQFAGIDGITESCVNAVLRHIQFGEKIFKVFILSYNQSHALILFTESYETIAIRSGFSSGYPGEGPGGFAYVLSLLREFDIEIEEYYVAKEVIDKIDNGM